MNFCFDERSTMPIYWEILQFSNIQHCHFIYFFQHSTELNHHIIFLLFINLPTTKNTFQCIICNKIITTIHEVNPLSCCYFYPFIHRVINSLIRLTHPISYLIRIFLNNIQCSIRASSVDDDVFNIRVSLIDNGKNGLFNSSNSIIRNCYNRN